MPVCEQSEQQFLTLSIIQRIKSSWYCVPNSFPLFQKVRDMSHPAPVEALPEWMKCDSILPISPVFFAVSILFTINLQFRHRWQIFAGKYTAAGRSYQPADRHADTRINTIMYWWCLHLCQYIKLHNIIQTNSITTLYRHLTQLLHAITDTTSIYDLAH